MDQRRLEARLESHAEHSFRSAGERLVAATLNEYGIPFIYEPDVPVNDNGQPRNLRPDFYLPEFNLYIEYYGRAGNREYDIRTAEKQTLYVANNVNVLPVYPWDLIQRWPDYLFEHLPTQTIQRRLPYRARDLLPENWTS